MVVQLCLATDEELFGALWLLFHIAIICRYMGGEKLSKDQRIYTTMYERVNAVVIDKQSCKFFRCTYDAQ